MPACQNCGRPYDPEQSFCAGCGRPILHYPAEASSGETEEAQPFAKKLSATQIAILGAIVGLLLGGVYLAYTSWRIAEQRKTEAALARALQENAFLPSGPAAKTPTSGKHAASHSAPTVAPAASSFVVNSAPKPARGPAKSSGRIVSSEPQVKAEAASNAPVPSPSVAAPARTPIRVLRETPPKFPLAAKLTLSTGDVHVRVAVGVAGEVLGTIALSGPHALRKAACESVQHWRFQPATQNGKPVADETEVVVSFTFEND